MQEYLTTADRSSVLTPQPALAFAPETPGDAGPVIRIDPKQSFQSIEGFGYTLTGGSADLLMQMSPERRHALLEELFGKRSGDLNISELRLTIGASDMVRQLYTYDDMPFGRTDPELRHFSLAPDRQSILPVMHEILAIRPDLHIMASPWTCPSWMKKGISHGSRDFLSGDSRRILMAFLFLLAGLTVTALAVRGRRWTASAIIVATSLVVLFTAECLLGLLFLLRDHPFHRTHGHVTGDFLNVMQDDDMWPKGRLNPVYIGRDAQMAGGMIHVLAAYTASVLWLHASDNHTTRSGMLAPRYYDAYARYLVRYFQAMQQEGIPIESMTIQNESEENFNNPSLAWNAEQQRLFVANSLGPELQRAGLKTRIIIYDHNADHIAFPEHILADPAAARFIDGSAFHLYAGSLENLSKMHEAYPAKNIYFTEQMVIEDTRNGVPWPATEPIRRIAIGALRNWSRDLILWNLASDSEAGPHILEGGCRTCLGAITIDGDHVERHLGYITLAHVSRFVPSGSVVIASNDTMPSGLGNVAFRTPDSGYALLVTNEGPAQGFRIVCEGREVRATLPHNAAATFTWN
ncbi:glycoside hydrolase family 30 protein [Silvibacterium sp.]|uniref:glycoside hydrolase family 30 protein n=1 Tax=Silvibacterium sp. TaxID=1964179 RepID=UPI0039E661EC